MLSWRSRIAAGAIVVGVPFFTAIAQSAATAPARPPVRILGVFDDVTDLPVVGAEVIDYATKKKTFTSVSGAVSLAFLDPGETVLFIRKIGYEVRMQTVTVSASDTAPITLLLKPLTFALAEVRITAAKAASGRLALFEQHRAEGFGHFLTGEQLEQAEGRQTSDVFRMVPGVVMRPDSRGTGWYVASNRGGGSCFATVMVNGAIVYGSSPGQTPFDVNSMRPEELAGVEFYKGGATTPIAYGGTHNGCGTVVIWTR
jgi:hypothetical protein